MLKHIGITIIDNAKATHTILCQVLAAYVQKGITEMVFKAPFKVI